MQFVNEDWSLWNLPIGFVPVLGSHTAEAVGNLIAEVVAPFLGTFLCTLLMLNKLSSIVNLKGQIISLMLVSLMEEIYLLLSLPRRNWTVLSRTTLVYAIY